jgi:hypothetical protein
MPDAMSEAYWSTRSELRSPVCTLRMLRKGGVQQALSVRPGASSRHRVCCLQMFVVLTCGVVSHP